MTDETTGEGAAEPGTEENQLQTGTSTPQTEPGTDPLQDATGTGADALGGRTTLPPSPGPPPTQEEPAQPEE